jgi:hypothetical protein
MLFTTTANISLQVFTNYELCVNIKNQVPYRRSVLGTISDFIPSIHPTIFEDHFLLIEHREYANCLLHKGVRFWVHRESFRKGYFRPIDTDAKIDFVDSCILINQAIRFERSMLSIGERLLKEIKNKDTEQNNHVITMLRRLWHFDEDRIRTAQRLNVIRNNISYLLQKRVALINYFKDIKTTKNKSVQQTMRENFRQEFLEYPDEISSNKNNLVSFKDHLHKNCF